MAANIIILIGILIFPLGDGTKEPVSHFHENHVNKNNIHKQTFLNQPSRLIPRCARICNPGVPDYPNEDYPDPGNCFILGDRIYMRDHSRKKFNSKPLKKTKEGKYKAVIFRQNFGYSSCRIICLPLTPNFFPQRPPAIIPYDPDIPHVPIIPDSTRPSKKTTKKPWSKPGKPSRATTRRPQITTSKPIIITTQLATSTFKNVITSTEKAGNSSSEESSGSSSEGDDFPNNDTAVEITMLPPENNGKVSTITPSEIISTVSAPTGRTKREA